MSMCQKLTQLELNQIANAGASFTVDSARKTQLELNQLANSCRAGGGNLTVMNAGRKTQLELVQLSNSGKGHITFIN
ncbi:hypothetical protein [Pseudomonas viridiflava]|uniref:Uncharacterized protein n=1 Tax=Pseudomonas viridiflava TaxID=33069 RepID=A0A3M5PLY7_PSEVI|nr:hypothetical protein [Pseudomonas viridiflava]RMT85063.1 hypothetical protein ALP40_03663 [Pseudomonas viridiflava]